MQLDTGGAVVSVPAASPGQVHARDQENLIFTDQKTIDWLIYSFLHKILCCLRNLYKFEFSYYDL